MNPGEVEAELRSRWPAIDMTTIEIPDDIDDVDHAALRLALATLDDEKRVDQIADMIKDHGWLYAAKFAAYSCQITNLRLKSWQPPPCCVADENEPRVGEEISAKVLRRMVKLDISDWHPDPLAALEECEKG
jgi:hypothetical protein